MLDETFRKFDQIIAAFQREAQQILAKAPASSISVASTGDLTVSIRNGKVAITGEMKELRINDRLVRLRDAK